MTQSRYVKDMSHSAGCCVQMNHGRDRGGSEPPSPCVRVHQGSTVPALMASRPAQGTECLCNLLPTCHSRPGLTALSLLPLWLILNILASEQEMNTLGRLGNFPSITCPENHRKWVPGNDPVPLPWLVYSGEWLHIAVQEELSPGKLQK